MDAGFDKYSNQDCEYEWKKYLNDDDGGCEYEWKKYLNDDDGGEVLHLLPPPPEDDDHHQHQEENNVVPQEQYSAMFYNYNNTYHHQQQEKYYSVVVQPPSSDETLPESFTELLGNGGVLDMDDTHLPLTALAPTPHDHLHLLPFPQSSGSITRLCIPVGYRFRPTEREIFECYLIPKLLNDDSFKVYEWVVREINVYGDKPSVLVPPPKSSFIVDDDDINEDDDDESDHRRCAYFFTRRKTRKRNGSTIERGTGGGGFWKMTSKINRPIVGRGYVGRKNSLVYYKSKKEKTNWIMHEYIVTELNGQRMSMSSVVMCRIYLRQVRKDDQNNED